MVVHPPPFGEAARRLQCQRPGGDPGQLRTMGRWRGGQAPGQYQPPSPGAACTVRAGPSGRGLAVAGQAHGGRWPVPW